MNLVATVPAEATKDCIIFFLNGDRVLILLGIRPLILVIFRFFLFSEVLVTLINLVVLVFFDQQLIL